MTSPYLFKLALLRNSSGGVQAFATDIEKQYGATSNQLNLRGPYRLSQTEYLQPLTASIPIFADGSILWAGALSTTVAADGGKPMAHWRIGPHFDLCYDDTSIRDERLWQDTRYPKPANLDDNNLINTQRRLSLVRPNRSGTTILCHFGTTYGPRGVQAPYPCIDLSQLGDDGQWYRLPINASPLSPHFRDGTNRSDTQAMIFDSYDPGSKYIYILSLVQGIAWGSIAQVQKSEFSQLRKEQHICFRPFDIANAGLDFFPIPLLTLGKSGQRRLYLLSIQSNMIRVFWAPLRADGSINSLATDVALQVDTVIPMNLPGASGFTGLKALDLLDGRVMLAWEETSASLTTPRAMIGELGPDGQLPAPNSWTPVQLVFPGGTTHPSDSTFYTVLVPKDFE